MIVFVWSYKLLWIAWRTRFLDLLVFNASKRFGPKYYPIDEEVHITM
jgi:hypothetical protein